MSSNNLYPYQTSQDQNEIISGQNRTDKSDDEERPSLTNASASVPITEFQSLDKEGYYPHEFNPKTFDPDRFEPERFDQESIDQESFGVSSFEFANKQSSLNSLTSNIRDFENFENQQVRDHVQHLEAHISQQKSHDPTEETQRVDEINKTEDTAFTESALSPDIYEEFLTHHSIKSYSKSGKTKTSSSQKGKSSYSVDDKLFEESSTKNESQKKNVIESDKDAIEVAQNFINEVQNLITKNPKFSGLKTFLVVQSPECEKYDYDSNPFRSIDNYQFFSTNISNNENLSFRSSVISVINDGRSSNISSNARKRSMGQSENLEPDILPSVMIPKLLEAPNVPLKRIDLADINAVKRQYKDYFFLINADSLLKQLGVSIMTQKKNHDVATIEKRLPEIKNRFSFTTLGEIEDEIVNLVFKEDKELSNSLIAKTRDCFQYEVKRRKTSDNDFFVVEKSDMPRKHDKESYDALRASLKKKKEKRKFILSKS